MSRPAAPGLAAEARGEARVAQRQVAGVDDLAGVQRRERHLARADEEQLVLRERVDLLLGVGQEARAEERLLADEHRRDDRLEAVAAQQLEHPAHERELEEDEVAAQVREARAGQLRRLLHVDHRGRRARDGRAGRRASAACRARSSDGVRVGRRRVGQVRQSRERVLQLGLDPRQLLGESLRAAGDLAHPRRSPRRREPPSRLAVAIASLAAFCSPRSASSSGRIARRRSSSSSTRSRPPSSPRRASAARTIAGSPRSSFRSSTAALAGRSAAGRWRRARDGRAGRRSGIRGGPAPSTRR